VIDTPDHVAYQQLFVRLSPPPLDERTAGEYVKLFVALRAEPYAAENLAATAALAGESFVVTTTYERTTVWSPPHLPAIAGARTVRIVENWQVARDGALTAREKSEQELRTVPARN
jgi:hypothetical protein